MKDYTVEEISRMADAYVEDVLETIEHLDALGIITCDDQFRVDEVDAIIVACQSNPEYLRDVVTDYVEILR